RLRLRHQPVQRREPEGPAAGAPRVPRRRGGDLVKRAWLIALVASACACATDLRTDFPFDGDLPAGDYVTFTDQGDGTWDLRVNAGEPQSWVFVDLDDRRQVPGAEAVGAAGWDVAFQRFRIISNGGVSGVGPVEVAVLPGQDFAALTTAPATGYVQDA